MQSDGRVYVIAGDGGLAYGLGELETAVRLGLDVTYIVLNNSAYGWIVDGEDRLGMADRSTFADVDFAAVARGFGAASARATTLNEVDEALGAARDTKGPHVIDVVTSSTVSPIVSLRSARSLSPEDPEVDS
jgi:acetolactate synthase-1/2/3 large subunit